VLIVITSVAIILSYIAYKYYVRAVENNQAWNIPVIDLQTQLLAHHSDKFNYTIFDTNKVAFRSQAELAELYLATDIDIKELVALKPERILLHEIIVQTITKLRWNTQDEMRAHVKFAVNNLIKSYQLKKIVIDTDVYRNNLAKNLTTSQQIDLTNIKTSYIPGKYVAHYTAKQAAIALQVDYKYKRYIEPRIRNLVTSYFEKLFKEQPHNRITVDPSKRPHTIIMAGGSASGKSTYGRLIQSQMAHNGIDWQNVVKVNTDSYKELLNIDDSKNSNIFYSQLVQPEAQIISSYRLKYRIGDLIRQKVIQNIFWDQVLIEPNKIEWGLLNNGVVSVHIVSADTTNSVQRSYARGKLTGRYEPTEMLLNFHKRVTQELPNIITRFAGKNVYISVLDNNVDRDSVIKVLEIFNAQKYAVIYDSNKLNNFISKTNINQKAKTSNELQQDRENIKFNNYFSVLTANGYTVNNKS
jgi:hypothetical protein